MKDLPTKPDGSLKLKLERKGEGRNYDICAVTGDPGPYFIVRECGKTCLEFQSSREYFATLLWHDRSRERSIKDFALWHNCPLEGSIRGLSLEDKPPGEWIFDVPMEYVSVPPPPPSSCIQLMINCQQRA